MLAEENRLPYLRPQGEEIDLVHLLQNLVSGWKVITAATVLAALAAWVYAQSSTPRYSTDVLIQVEKKQGGLLPGGLSPIMPELPSGTQSEIELLKSRMLLGKTVRQAGLQTVITPVYFSLLGSKWAELTKTVPPLPVLENVAMGEGKSAILEVVDDQRYTLLAGNQQLEGIVGQPLRGKGIRLTVTELDAGPGSRFTLRQMTERQAIAALKQSLTVASLGNDSGMLTLTLKGTQPRPMAHVLNLLAENYLQQNVTRQRDKEARSLAFLEQLLAEVRTTLNEAEEKLNTSRQLNDSVDLNLETKAILEQLAGIDTQLNALSFEEAEIAQRYKKGHPTYLTLAEKRRALEQEKRRLNQRVSNMPSIQQTIFRLSREVDSGREVYMQLLTRQQELSITRSGVTGNVRIIDVAHVPAEPEAPKKALTVILGTLLGFIFTCGVILARRLFTPRIDTAGQLEAIGLKVYTSIPHSAWLMKHARKQPRKLIPLQTGSVADVSPLLCLENPSDLCVEAIRGLRTSLWFETMETGRKVLVICGATENSGKTFLSTALATLMAQSGQKVLFIDADMRRGDAHLLFGLHRGEGLSALLKGDIPFQQAVRHFHRGGFDVITRGKPQLDPTHLLMGNRLSDLLAWAKDIYDMVIIDTPPVLAVSDAAIVGKQPGSLTLLVTRARLNSLKETTLSMTRLEREGVNVQGIVLNGVGQNKVTDYCYGYRSAGYRYQGEEEGAS